MDHSEANQSGLRIIPKVSVSVSATVPIREGEQKNPSSNNDAAYFWRFPSHLHASERSSSLKMSWGSRHGLYPNFQPFISSSTFQSLSGDLYRTTPTDLSRYVSGVCISEWHCGHVHRNMVLCDVCAIVWECLIELRG